MPKLNVTPQPIEINFSEAAIVVVDMQNAFASKGGMFDLAGIDISGAQKAIEANKSVLNAARKADIQIIYLQMLYQNDLSDAGGPLSPNYHKELAMIQMREKPEHYGQLLTQGSWDGEIVSELKPHPEDRIIVKTRYSGFANTELDDYLRTKEIRYLFFTGIATNICVESTARDAYFNEYWPILVEDAMNHSGPDFMRDATIWNFENVFGWVTNSSELVSAFQTKE